MNRITRFAAAAFCVLATASHAQGVTIARTPGGDFAIPDPPGLVSLKDFNTPYLLSTAQMQAEVGNRLLVLMLPRPDAQKAEKREFPTPHEWAFAFSGVRGEQVKMPPDLFRKHGELVLTNLAKELTAPLPRDAAGMEAAAKAALAEPNLTAADAGKASKNLPLGVYAMGDDHVVFGTVSYYLVDNKGKLEPGRTVRVFARIIVKERMIELAWFRHLKAREDIDAARASMVAWAKDVMKRNK